MGSVGQEFLVIAIGNTLLIINNTYFNKRKKLQVIKTNVTCQNLDESGQAWSRSGLVRDLSMDYPLK